MVNLLFISSSSKIAIIKNVLQPLLKVKIDVVGDFDFGLKEVFEKRPAMVFIQDQISGVTGESVARHIQMLLGSGAPLFIFMHDGNPKAKTIKGLYDYLIDLSQDANKVASDIQYTLKSILGPQWQKLYIPPKAGKAVAMSSLAVPEETRTVADQLVDDFISGLGEGATAPVTSDSSFNDLAASDVADEEPFSFISSPQDQLAEIISENAREQEGLEAAKVAAQEVKTEKMFTPSGPTAASVKIETPAPPPEKSKPVVDASPAAADIRSSGPAVSAPGVRAASTALKNSTPSIQGVTEKSPSPPLSPADFRIEKSRIAEDAATVEALRAFEANYLSNKSRKRFQAVSVLVVLCLALGGWYLAKQNPHLVQKSVVKESPPSIVPAPAAQAVKPLAAVQKTVSTTHRAETSVLPSFIPLAGQDRSFASQKPGWERYVGPVSEFRLYRPAGKLKAVQVLATKDHVISDAALKAILIELTGTDGYRVTSNEQKHGYQVSRATVNRKVDLLIYRKKSAIHACVVSLD